MWIFCLFIANQIKHEKEVVIKKEYAEDDEIFAATFDCQDTDSLAKRPRLSSQRNKSERSTFLSPQSSPDAHMTHEAGPGRSVEPTQSHTESAWFTSGFRDCHDMDYTAKLLRQSLGSSVPDKSEMPTPVEVLARIFPTQSRLILELILKGCQGNLVHAIQCMVASNASPIFSNSGMVPVFPPINANGSANAAVFPNTSLGNGGLQRSSICMTKKDTPLTTPPPPQHANRARRTPPI